MAQKYNFYIQKIPEGVVNETLPLIDIESYFNCHYKEFKDIFWNGDVQNSYSEVFAENDGERLWLPDKEDMTFSAYDCTLQLLFKKETCQEDIRKFYGYVAGSRIEYHDTFRNRYLHLVLLKQPQIQQEILYGDSPYILCSFTFRNFKGRSYSESQIK